MSAYHEILDEKDRSIRYLYRIAIGLVAALILAVWGWKGAQQDITVYYPPNINVANKMEAGFVPEETVYSFSVLIMQQLYLWEKNADVDYEANSYRLRQFLHDDFRRKIQIEDALERSKGTRKNLQRTFQILPSSVYTEEAVEPKADHWIVWFDAEIKDVLNKVEVYKRIHRMGVKVIRYDINREYNPWSLAIAGIVYDEPLFDERELEKLRATGEAP